MPSPNEPSPPPRLFDRARIARRLARVWTGAPDFVTQLVLDDLADRLASISRSFGKAAILGPEPRALPTAGRSASGAFSFTPISTLVPAKDIPLIDPDRVVLPGRDHDLVVSVLDLQIIDDVPGFLVQLRHHLKPDGLLLAACLGGRSLVELRAAWLAADSLATGGAYLRVAPFMDVRDAGALLQRAGYALPVADVESHRVRYADSLALMREIAALGAANPMAARPARFTTRGQLAAAVAAYEPEADGRVTATLEILWLSGWAPHESQQQPLKPGSATTRLGDVLKGKR